MKITLTIDVPGGLEDLSRRMTRNSTLATIDSALIDLIHFARETNAQPVRAVDGKPVATVTCTAIYH